MASIKEWISMHPIRFYAIIGAAAVAVIAVIVFLAVKFGKKSGNEEDSKLLKFFRERETFLLGAALLGIIAFFVYQLIINGRIDTANRSRDVGSSIGNAIGGLSLVPAMIITLVSMLISWIGWIFKQRWAALVAGIGFGIALLLSLTRFYVPILPMCLAIVSYVRSKPNPIIAAMKSEAAEEPAQPAAAATAPPAAAPSLPTEELRQLKDLLDTGVITQEEFEAKKKQLLGL